MIETYSVVLHLGISFTVGVGSLTVYRNHNLLSLKIFLQTL